MRIAFMIVSLNDLDVFVENIGNAYLNAPCHEKIWTQSARMCHVDSESTIYVEVRQ